MKLKQTTLAAALTAALALGMAGHASASIYAGSSLDIQNLVIGFGGVNPDPTKTKVDSFAFTLLNVAQLNGDLVTNEAKCDSIAATPTPACSAISPVLGNVAANPVANTKDRIDGAGDNWAFYGPGVNTYANSDSEITTAQLAQGVPTSTKSISEAEVQGTGSANANTLVQSQTQLTIDFIIDAPLTGNTFTVTFEADPDLFAQWATPGAAYGYAQADTSTTLTLRGGGNASGVSLSWTPDGLVGSPQICAGGITCLETADGEALTNTVGTTSNNPNSQGISDNRDASFPDKGWSLFGLNVTGLKDGNYTLTLATTTSVNVEQVPEPGVLGLVGLGLLGMGIAARRNKRS